MVIAAFMGSELASIFQSKVLRNIFTDELSLNNLEWRWRTFLGWFISVIIISINSSERTGSLITLMSEFTSSIMALGIIISGILQWTYLFKKVKWSILWIPGTIISGAAAGGSILGLVSLINGFAGYFVGNIIGGLSSSIISGYLLSLLLEYKQPITNDSDVSKPGGSTTSSITRRKPPRK